MSSFKKSKLFFPLVFILLLLLQHSCSDRSEFGEASDYEKYGATATATGSGTIEGAVLTSSGSVLSGVSVSYASGTLTYSTTSDSSGLFTQSSLATGTYTLSYSKSGYLNEAQYATLETDGETIEVATLRMLPNSCATTGDISGTITSALSITTTISGATINAYKNVWSKRSLAYYNPSVTKTTDTATNGTYTFSDMPRGYYTLFIIKSGYITNRFLVYSCGDIPNMSRALSPTLPSNSMRIILSWPDTSPVIVYDLDSHLTGPDNDTDNVSSRFHVYYSGQKKYFYSTGTYTNCSGCSTSEMLDNVTLNRDDAKGSPAYAPPGTETITVGNVKSSGTYRYSVQDFSNKALTNSDNLSKSGASVNVNYNDGSTTTSKTYGVPTNKIATLWEVFTFTTSGGFVKEKNMSNEATPADIE
jgi:hypothetical protein